MGTKKKLIEPISPPPKINGYYKGRNRRHLMTDIILKKYPDTFYYMLQFSLGRERVKQSYTVFMDF